MKKGTSGHPKVADLARRLRIDFYAALGLLQLLWDFAEAYAPCGDVGRFSDGTIAEKLHWKKDGALLVQGLVGARWLEEHPLHRLVVHDWSEHCEDSVHRKVARMKAFFWDGKAPKLARLGKDERHDIETFYAQGAHRNRTDVRTSDGILRTSVSQPSPSSSPLPRPLPLPEPSPSPGPEADEPMPMSPAGALKPITEPRPRRSMGELPPTELGEYFRENGLAIDEPGLLTLWRDCRRLDPGCSWEEIAHLASLKRDALRDRSTRNPAGLLIAVIPTQFRGEGSIELRQFRERVGTGAA